MNERRGKGSERHLGGVPGGMAVLGPDMRAHRFGRQKVPEGRVHALALERVVSVRHPDAAGVRQNAQVGAPAAGGAGLDLQLRQSLALLRQQTVQPQHVGAHAHATIRPPRMREVAVHVALDDVNARAAQHGADLFARRR